MKIAYTRYEKFDYLDDVECSICLIEIEVGVFISQVDL